MRDGYPAAHGADGVITVLQCEVADLVLPEKVDVIITSNFGWVPPPSFSARPLCAPCPRVRLKCAFGSWCVLCVPCEPLCVVCSCALRALSAL